MLCMGNATALSNVLCTEDNSFIKIMTVDARGEQPFNILAPPQADTFTNRVDCIHLLLFLSGEKVQFFITI